MAKPNSLRIFMQGVKNYRMWCMVATYGSCFGLMNPFARSLGGIASDLTASKYGMRGRLWALWIMQTLEGGLCIVMGRLYMTLPGTLVVMILFSTVVQMSEGASYAV